MTKEVNAAELVKPTEEGKSLFLNKKEGDYGIFYSKNLTPNEGRNYLTINLNKEGEPAVISAGPGTAAPLKPNTMNSGYHGEFLGYMAFIREVKTEYGDALTVAIVEKKEREKKEEEADASAPKAYGDEKFNRGV